MSIQYRISSRSKETGSNNNFTATCDITMLCKSIVVKHVSIPNLFDNVRAGMNALDLTGAADVVVTPRFYTVAQLCTALVVAGTTWTYDSALDRIVVANASGVNITLLSTSTIAPLLGFVASIIVVDGTSETLPYPPNLFNYTHLYVLSNQLSGGHNMITRTADGVTVREPVIAVIPNTATYGEMIDWRPSIEETEAISYESRKNINQVDIRIVDELGQDVFIPPNHHVEILLQLIPNR